VHLHTVAADLLRQIAENAEAGDHRQRFGSRSLAGRQATHAEASSRLAASRCRMPDMAVFCAFLLQGSAFEMPARPPTAGQRPERADEQRQQVEAPRVSTIAGPAGRLA
jgi:hypothetical protein